MISKGKDIIPYKDFRNMSTLGLSLLKSGLSGYSVFVYNIILTFILSLKVLTLIFNHYQGRKKCRK